MSAPTIPAPLPALEFEVPLVNPSPGGLYSVTSWTEVTGPSRFLGEGVRFRMHNYLGAVGVWESEWCVDPDGQLKEGERPENPEPFAPIVVWAFDSCDTSSPSQQEVRERAAQNLRLLEQTAVEREFAERLLIDAGPDVPEFPAVLDALAYLERELAETNTTGFIHASAGVAALLSQGQVLTRNGAALKTPLGHTLVLGGGYVRGLDNILAATSPTYGWRGPVEIRGTIDPEHNQYLVVAERSLAVGYEKFVAAAKAFGIPGPDADARGSESLR